MSYKDINLIRPANPFYFLHIERVTAGSTLRERAEPLSFAIFPRHVKFYRYTGTDRSERSWDIHSPSFMSKLCVTKSALLNMFKARVFDFLRFTFYHP